VRTALRAYRFPAEGAILYLGEHLVGTVAMIQRAHDGQVLLTTLGAGRFVDHQVTGIALVTTIVYWNILKPLEPAYQFLLLFTPLHTIQ
jgi:hypothetical protein